jgi:hypothetical protein
MNPNVCSSGNCSSYATRRTKQFGPLCEAHYKKWQRYGEPIGKKELFEKNVELIASLRQDIEDMQDGPSCQFVRCNKCRRLHVSTYRCYFCGIDNSYTEK